MNALPDYIEDEETAERVQRLHAFVASLEAEAKRRMDRRTVIERRWIEDLRQFHGSYDEDTIKRMKKKGGSKVFVNVTRPKTTAVAAKLMDLLFPTDDRAWMIQPTPVPELDGGEDLGDLRETARKAVEDREQAVQQAQERGADDLLGPAQEELKAAEDILTEVEEAHERNMEIMREARSRSLLMQEEIDDQLKQSRHQTEARDACEDACKIGIGILKGPIRGDRLRQRWVASEVTGPDGKTLTVHELKHEEDPAPAVYRVDPWGFFPDPDCRRPADGEGVFERHLLNAKQMRKLAQRPSIDEEVVRTLLALGPRESAPSFMVDLVDLTGQSQASMKDLFHVWEYIGPIDAETMKLLAEVTGEDVSELDFDPLTELTARVFFCQGKLLSFAPHYLDSGETPYSVYNLEEDEASPFGFGVPCLMRHPQSVLNAAVRMMMDNAGLGTAPQIVMSEDEVEPADGVWDLRPGKLWKRKKDSTGRTVFETYSIPMHQAELSNIIVMAQQFIDEETSLPKIAQGEQGTGVTKTAQGMALLMNSANIVMRRWVKAWDDNITVPLIRRFYHWNMQFSDKDYIKGDFEVDARGSSVLLVREMMAQNLLMVAQIFGQDPNYAGWLKHRELMHAVFRAHMISASEIVKTETEYRADQEKLAQQPDVAAQMEQQKAQIREGELKLKEFELQMKERLGKLEWATRGDIAKLEYDAKMAEVAEDRNIANEKIEADLEKKSVEESSKERRLAAEIALRDRTGESSGGSV